MNIAYFSKEFKLPWVTYLRYYYNCFHYGQFYHSEVKKRKSSLAQY